MQPRPQSRHQKFGPKASESRPDAEERAEVWGYGLRDLYLRLRGALDSVRALIALSRRSRGIGLAPLCLARPVMEAAADTYLLLGVDAKHDPLPRFYAGWLRELTRENDSFEWVIKYDPSAVDAFKQRWLSVLGMAPRLGFKIEYGTGARMSRLVGSLPASIVTSRGKSVPVAPSRSSTLGSISADLLQNWRIASGAAHGAPWLTGGEFQRVDSFGHNPDPWIVALRTARVAIEDICSLNFEFLGWTSESDVQP